LQVKDAIDSELGISTSHRYRGEASREEYGFILQQQLVFEAISGLKMARLEICFAVV
jgi:hypothetical protein